MNAIFNDETGVLEISWDPTDKVESVFNEWTEDDFINRILDAVNKVLENNKMKTFPMYELVDYEVFRNTPSVKFYDITIDNSNARDLVVHTGPAISPNNDEIGGWQFYMHNHQEDNLLAVSGGRTFYLVNPNWEVPYHAVRVKEDGKILRIPPGTYHRSVSDVEGSIVVNQAVRDEQFDVESEFTIYKSSDIPELARCLPMYPDYNGNVAKRVLQVLALKNPPDNVDSINRSIGYLYPTWEISQTIWRLVSDGTVVVQSGRIKLNMPDD